MKLYHVTYFSRLPRIARNGLVANASSSIGRGGYAGHSANRIFLTSARGVSFWYDRAVTHAEDRSDDVQKDKLAPVVLRVADVLDLVEDPAGSRDARAPAYWIETTIPASSLAVYDGKGWISVNSWQTIPWKTAFDDDGYLISWQPPFEPRGLIEMCLSEARAIVCEIFDKPVRWRIKRMGGKEIEVRFTAIGHNFVYYAERLPSGNVMDVRFAILGPGNEHVFVLTGIGGLSGGATVFATVLDITTWLLHVKPTWVSQIHAVIFSAKEPSRIRLYRRILQRFTQQIGATWREERASHEDGSIIFRLQLPRDAKAPYHGTGPEGGSTDALAAATSAKARAVEAMQLELAQWSWSGADWEHECGREEYDSALEDAQKVVSGIEDTLTEIATDLESEAEEWDESHSDIADALRKLANEIEEAKGELSIEPWSDRDCQEALESVRDNLQSVIDDTRDRDEDNRNIAPLLRQVKRAIRSLDNIEDPGNRECDTCEEAEKAAANAQEFVEKAINLAKDDKWEKALEALETARRLERDFGDSPTVDPFIHIVATVVEDHGDWS